MEAEERASLNYGADHAINEINNPTQAESLTSADNDNASIHHEDEEVHPANGTKRKRTPPPEGMTISAFKKLKRQQRWEAGKADRKAKKKEHDRAKKEARRAAIASGEAPPPPPKTPKEKSTLVPVTIVIDCGFDELMTEQEIKSLASQITRCYSDNSRSKFRFDLAISGFDQRLKERFDGVLGGQYKVWKGIKFYGEDFVEVADGARERMKNGQGVIEGALKPSDVEGSGTTEEGEVVYLSSESENTIEHLQPHSTYVIGGLVDRNRHKGLCYKRACERGIKTAKLPIGDFMEMNGRQVLATNHVNEIMLHWLDVGDWGEAFMKVIPKRKGGILKNGSKGTNLDEEDEENEGDVHDELEEASCTIESQRRASQAEDKADGSSTAEAMHPGK